MKNGRLPFKKDFADLILLIEEEQGKPQYDSYYFRKNIFNFVEKVAQKYQDKKLHN